MKPSPSARMFCSCRDDGRFVTTPAFVHDLLKRTHPRLAFDPAFTRLAFLNWKRRVRRRLRALLAFPDAPPQPAPRLIASARREGYTLQRWELYPEPACVVPFLVLVPYGVSARRPAPAVLCCPGTDHPKEALAGELWKGPFSSAYPDREDMARRFARAGFVALAFDNPGVGKLADRRAADWRRQSEILLWMGRSYEGLSVFQKWTALQWLKRQPWSDRRRLAVCGHSLGAKPAILLALLDPAIRAVVWNGGAVDWRRRHLVLNLKPVAPWHYVPGFIRWFDYADLMAALAPTPLLVTEGGRGEVRRAIRRAYALMDASASFTFVYMPRFAAASARRWDRRSLPEGLTEKQYARYSNFSGEHHFKGDVAVPWLCRQFGLARR